jgi:hypothetical protein
MSCGDRIGQLKLNDYYCRVLGGAQAEIRLPLFREHAKGYAKSAHRHETDIAGLSPMSVVGEGKANNPAMAQKLVFS